MSEESYDLRDSKRSVRELYPVLKDAHGNVIDGFHRLIADPEWHTETLEHIKTPTQLALARIVANTHRRTITREERAEKINELARCLTEHEKLPREKLIPTIAILTTFSDDYIRRLLNDEYKLKPGVGGGPRDRILKNEWDSIPQPKLANDKLAAFNEKLLEMGIVPAGMPSPEPGYGEDEAEAPGSPEVTLSTQEVTEEIPATPQEYVEQNFRPYQIRTKEDAVAFAWVLTRKYPITQHEAEVIIREWLKAKQVKPQKSTEKSEAEFAVSPLPTSKYEPKPVVDIYSKLEQYYPVTIIDYVVKYTDSTTIETLVKYCRTYIEKLDLKTSSDLRQTILEEMLK